MPTSDNDSSQNQNESILKLIQDIGSGAVDPKLIDKETRQRCVEALSKEGYPLSHIADLLHWSEKTVQRDLTDIKKKNALSPNIEFAKQFVGDIFQKAMSHHSYLMRLARSRDATISEKTQSEYAAWKILKELIEKFQTLGYLPMKPTEIVGTFFHGSDSDKEPTIDEMKAMVLRIEEAAKEAGILDAEAVLRIQALRKRIEQLELAQDIKKLEDGTTKREDHHE